MTPRSDRARLKRLPKRGTHERAVIDRILDMSLICHVAFVQEGQPYVIPMAFARRGDEILLHGSIASRLMKHLASGADVSLAVTHLDAVVVARSAFHSSMNYQSVVLFGRGREISDPEEKREALDLLTDHLIPGRSAEARPPSAGELAGTAVVALAIEECTAKVRTGPPLDEEEDYALPVWAGVIPLETRAGTPEDDGKVPAEAPVPDSVRAFIARLG